MSDLTSVMDRREFCVAAAGGLVTAIAGCRQGAAGSLAPQPSRLEARPTPPTTTTSPGTYPLKLGDVGDRDGFLYVPPGYRHAVPAPLVILLHGAGQSSFEWSKAPLESLFGSQGVVALVPDSRGTSWDIARGGYGPDVRFLDRALGATYARCNIDPARIALGG